ncbi:hypothetical protein T11_10097 [Trichinella zimbabwensis]|uniref:Uncharacterized protein n=1 Tax=Trichinella zimbabwensis TaxID=268475 RepID=A0A0V1HY19_9BILA|nr:hypothetical protein T11_10097 [Trichinella zimbabwensis]
MAKNVDNSSQEDYPQRKNYNSPDMHYIQSNSSIPTPPPNGFFTDKERKGTKFSCLLGFTPHAKKVTMNNQKLPKFLRIFIQMT